jgi:hypothetical protein
MYLPTGTCTDKFLGRRATVPAGPATDLRRDVRAGIAEKGIVIAAGLASAGLLLGWIALAIAHGRRAGTRRPDPVIPYIWDCEFDG